MKLAISLSGHCRLKHLKKQPWLRHCGPIFALASYVKVQHFYRSAHRRIVHSRTLLRIFGMVSVCQDKHKEMLRYQITMAGHMILAPHVPVYA